jgi:hypothetical protein
VQRGIEQPPEQLLGDPGQALQQQRVVICAVAGLVVGDEEAVVVAAAVNGHSDRGELVLDGEPGRHVR